MKLKFDVENQKVLGGRVQLDLLMGGIDSLGESIKAYNNTFFHGKKIRSIEFNGFKEYSFEYKVQFLGDPDSQSFQLIDVLVYQPGDSFPLDPKLFVGNSKKVGK